MNKRKIAQKKSIMIASMLTSPTERHFQQVSLYTRNEVINFFFVLFLVRNVIAVIIRS